MLTEHELNFGKVKGIRVGGSLFGKPLMTVIFYYVDNTLIDTGSFRTRKLLNRFSDDHTISRIALTHFHEDHAGNAKFLQQKLNVPLLGSQGTAEKLKNHIPLKPYEHFIFGKVEKACVTPITDNFQSEKHKFNVIHTPGHSNDHTVYYEAHEGWVFSGDLFLAPKLKLWRKDEEMLTSIQSIKKVLELDFSSLFCGHNPQIKNPKEKLKKKLENLESLIDKVKNHMESGLPDRSIITLMTKNREKYLTKCFTLGDVSYKNMIIEAIKSAKKM